MNRYMLRIGRSLWQYRLARWIVYSVVGLLIADRAILLASDHFELMPQEPVIFPHQEIPESQLPVLRDLRFAGEHLRNALTPVLLPEDSQESQFALLDTLLRNVETRRDIAWITLVESDIQSALGAITATVEGRSKPLTEHTIFKGVYNEYGIPLTEAEESLAKKYDIYARAKRAQESFNAHKYNKGLPETWDAKYVDGLVPPVDTEAEEKDSYALDMSKDQQVEAQEWLAYLLRRRNKAIAYLKKNPPKPMAWAPLTSDAYKTTSKVDIQSGNLHNRPDWKPIYRSWSLEDGWTFYEDPDQSEEDAAADLQGMIKSNEDHARRRRRKEEYLAELRKETPSDEAGAQQAESGISA